MNRHAAVSIFILLLPVAFVRGDADVRLDAGKFGKALDARVAPAVLDGNPRYGHAPLTVECWVRLLGKGQRNVILASDEVSSSSHWQVFTAKDTGRLGLLTPGLKPTELLAHVDVCDGQWHHLAVVFDGKSVKLCLDGQIVAEQAVEGLPARKAVTGQLMIGGVGTGKERIGCHGLIDEVRISGSVRPLAKPSQPPVHDPYAILIARFDRPDDFEADPAWTPLPVGKPIANWERATDKDWVDARLRDMDTGPFLNHTFDYPSWADSVKVYKGTAIRIGERGEGSVLFDRGQVRLAAGWLGPYLVHSSRRFGLLNTPRPAAELTFTTGEGPGWADPNGKWPKPVSQTMPLPPDWAAFQGLELFGPRVRIRYTVGGVRVFEAPWLESRDGITAFRRSIHVEGPTRPMRTRVCDLPAAGRSVSREGITMITATRDQHTTAVALVGGDQHVRLETVGERVELALAPPGLLAKVLIWQGLAGELDRFAALVKASPAPEEIGLWKHEARPPRWPVSETRGVVGTDDGPFAVDILTLPFDNPHKALLFVSGIDFLPNGDVVVCTAHGDVWIVSGADDKLNKLTWRRFATGLYQPLGLVTRKNRIFVLERGQITLLVDDDGNGEADTFVCLWNRWDTGGGQHSYDTCLERGPDGSLYFFKTGDTETPTGGCLLRVDGPEPEIFATGFRHPIGLGMSPDGILTGADQQGNWVPATRLDQYRKGGFYGDMRAHHRATPPATYDPPLLWLPREFDNSAGGQVWVPKGSWGPLGGQLMHLSYGRCRALLVMRQEVEDAWQAGAVSLPPTFQSGVMRGRFHPRDGHLYLVGLKGWETAAANDGCLQRLRYTGRELRMPIGMSVHRDGIRITFSEPLDPKSAADVKSYRIEQWNYRWSAEYGSKRWSVANPDRIAQDPVPVRAAELAEDGRTVFLRIDGLKPVMQMQIQYDLTAQDGQKVSGAIANTIHQLAKSSH